MSAAVTVERGDTLLSRLEETSPHQLLYQRNARYLLHHLTLQHARFHQLFRWDITHKLRLEAIVLHLQLATMWPLMQQRLFQRFKKTSGCSFCQIT